MSTANKLSYLNDTKSLLRTSLNKFGSSILSTDTFRSYDTKLNEIYDKLPKVTQSGAGLTITPVQNGQVDDFKMIGTDLEQDTTTGKQLFDINSEMNTNSLIDAGITSTFNEDGTITVNGEKTANYKYIRYSVTLPAGTYYFCGCPSGGSNSSYSSLVQLTQDVSSQIFDTGNGGTFTLTEQTAIQYFPVRVGNASLTFNNTIFKPMISTNPVTYDDFEKYTGGIPSPNPDYPQEIKVVEGRQVITDKGKNLFTLDNQLLVLGNVRQSGNNQEFTLTGFGMHEAIIYKVGLIKDFVGKTLTFKCDYTTTSDLSNEQLGLIYCDNDGSNRNILSLFSKDNNTMTTTYTIPSSIDGNLTLAVRLYGTGSVNNSSTTYMNVQLEENSTATDYEPYYNPVSYNIDLNLENIYLAKMPNTTYKNKIYKNNGNWYFEENVKKVMFDGSENWYYVNNSSYSESIIRYRCDDFTDVLSTGYGAFILSSNFKGFPLGHRTENGIARQLDSSGLNIFIDKSITNNSLTNFKNWLSTNNVEVWYPLVNPVTTQITNTTLIDQLEAISVYTGTNIITISNDNNIIPEIEITRLKELEKLA